MSILIHGARQHSAQSQWFFPVLQGQGHSQKVSFDSVAPGGPGLGVKVSRQRRTPVVSLFDKKLPALECLGNGHVLLHFFFLGNWLIKQKTHHQPLSRNHICKAFHTFELVGNTYSKIKTRTKWRLICFADTTNSNSWFHDLMSSNASQASSWNFIVRTGADEPLLTPPKPWDVSSLTRTFAFSREWT